MVIEQHGLLARSRSIQEELETRKLVERAKDMLASDAHVTGEEAYRRMQKQSMNARKSMREIAEAVILSKSVKR